MLDHEKYSEKKKIIRPGIASVAVKGKLAILESPGIFSPKNENSFHLNKDERQCVNGSQGYLGILGRKLSTCKGPVAGICLGWSEEIMVGPHDH